MPVPYATNLLEHLAHRGDVLECLQDGIHDSREIAGETDQSRSNVDRDVRLLKDGDFVRELPDGYELTRFGEYALELYRLADSLARAEEFVPHLPPKTPVAVLRGADVRRAGGTVPQRPIDEAADPIRTADTVNVIAPAVVPVLTELLLGRVRNGTVAGGLVVSADVLADVRDPYSGAIRGCLGSETFGLRKTDEELPFGLALVGDELASLFVYDDRMRLLGTITNDSDVAVEWARETYRAYRDGSEPVRLRDVPRQRNRSARPVD